MRGLEATPGEARLDTPKASFWRRRIQPALERVAAAAGLVACSPVLAAAALCTLAGTGRPVLFRQQRAGRRGNPFTLLKLRTMRTGAQGSRITVGGDPRVTRVGSFLRRYKLDELPQLWNIAAGHMQFIGPRPELPALVDTDDPLWRAVLDEKPGLTDLSTLAYRNEEEVLAAYRNPDSAYREEILPRKLTLSAHYLRHRTVASDCRLLFLTVRYSFVPAGFDPEKVKRQFAFDKS